MDRLPLVYTGRLQDLLFEQDSMMIQDRLSAIFSSPEESTPRVISSIRPAPPTLQTGRIRMPFRYRLKWIHFKSRFSDRARSLLSRARGRTSRVSPFWRVLGLALLLVTLAGCGPFGISVEYGDPDSDPQVVTTDLEGTGDSITPPEITVEVTPIGPVSDPDVPELVWVPFTSGPETMGGVVVVRPDMVGFEPSPVDFAMYWDYSGGTGKLAYASEFWHPARGSNRSVSDLWVYNYDTGEASEWLPDNVARALWSPLQAGRFSDQRLAAAIYNTEEGQFDLALVGGPGQIEWLANCASETFSWSPDGTQLAYVAYDYNNANDVPEECEGVFIVSPEHKTVTRISGPLKIYGGWVGSRPIWAEGQDVLLFPGASPETLFYVIPLDGSGAFEIDPEATLASTGQEYLPSPQHNLWSPEHRSLIGQTEGMLDPWGVWVYTFAEDMRSVEDAYRIDWGEYGHDILLLGWWDEGDSVLLRDITNTTDQNPFGVAMVWSLSDRYAFELGFTRAQIEVPLYPPQARSGVEEIDRIIDAFFGQKYESRKPLTRTLTAACTTTEFAVGPPLCREGQAEGTRVEVFPYRQGRGSRYATPEELDDLLQFPLGGIYAVYRIPQDGFEETWWPRGEYGIMFVSAEGDLGVELIVEGGQVVRIEFWPITPVEALTGWEPDYILPPVTP